MGHSDIPRFSKKHGPDIQLDPKIEAEISQRAKNRKIPCAVAFDIAKNLNVAVRDIGVAVDLMDYRLTKCQLGLFGYEPDNKMITPLESVDSKIKAQISKGLVNGRLPCKTAWEIAERLKVGKKTISKTCETLEIKIKPCQLGAF